MGTLKFFKAGKEPSSGTSSTKYASRSKPSVDVVEAPTIRPFLLIPTPMFIAPPKVPKSVMVYVMACATLALITKKKTGRKGSFGHHAPSRGAVRVSVHAQTGPLRPASGIKPENFNLYRTAISRRGHLGHRDQGEAGRVLDANRPAPSGRYMAQYKKFSKVRYFDSDILN